MINKLKTALAALGRDDSGATAIEYGLMAGLISVGLLLLVNTVTADNLSAVFNALSDGIPGGPDTGTGTGGSGSSGSS
ncbi:MAG: Flp family type IVb pilin [Pseudomonadota bacterium]